jgi:hypothetical protein
MIWFFTDALDLHRAIRHDLHLSTGMAPSLYCHRREAAVSIIELTVETISHHTPRCKTKLDALLLFFCKFYVASRAFAQEPFLTYEHKATTLINKLFL